jgi:ATP-binding cassette subfamily B protein
MRIRDISNGAIYIDGFNIREDITQASLRNNISYIPQEPLLFNRTLWENIRYGKPNATDKEVIDVTKKASCYDFIASLEKGFDTIVGERGVKLSGGQRQRIAIARAMLKNSRILILDEATSALDSVTEQEIHKALNNLMENKTVLVIAHRLSTLNIMDRIVVIDNGRILEDGTKGELLSSNGLFKKMWDMQKGGILG